MVNSNGPGINQLYPRQFKFVHTCNNGYERSSCCACSSKTGHGREGWVCSSSVDMCQRVEVEVLLEPCGICVFRALVHREGDCSNQSNTSQRSSHTTKEPPVALRLVCTSYTVHEAIIFIRLHSSLDGIQRELITSISNCYLPMQQLLTAEKVEHTLLTEAAISVR